MSSPVPLFEVVLRVPLPVVERERVVDHVLEVVLEHGGSFSVRKLGIPCGSCRKCGSPAFANEAGTQTCPDCGALKREEVSIP